VGFGTAQFFGVWRVAFRNVPTCSEEPFAVIFILKAGGVGSPERALSRHSGDVLLMSPLEVQTAVMVWTDREQWREKVCTAGDSLTMLSAALMV
jgi:hypothetical protein